jgi:LPS export ABC transporter protein LptC
VRSSVVMIVLAILAAATWFWLATWQRGSEIPAVDRVTEAAPTGYFARGARIVGTDEQGRPTYRIVAERLDELPGEDRLKLTGVSVDYQPPDEAAWSLSAATAVYERDGSKLDFAGGVEIRSAPTDSADPVTITTEQLVLSPDTSRAESDAAVEIRVGGLQLRGVGLRADLKGDTLRLESLVHGKFVP